MRFLAFTHFSLQHSKMQTSTSVRHQWLRLLKATIQLRTIFTTREVAR